METIIRSLENNREVFISLLKNVPDDLIRFKISPEKWNALEIICHLVDEEREDFRARLKSVLEDPLKPFTPIDPAGWVNSRKYNDRNFQETLAAFSEERINSIQYLRSLREPPWQNIHMHPTIGPMSSAFILSNWLAHDYLHIRQITKLKYDFLAVESGENLSYAGSW